MSKPLYSIGTWDTELQAYTPQAGLLGPSIGIDLWTLKARMTELRQMCYTVHYRRDADGSHDDNDWAVLIERTDDLTETEVLESWKR